MSPVVPVPGFAGRHLANRKANETPAGTRRRHFHSGAGPARGGRRRVKQNPGRGHVLPGLRHRRPREGCVDWQYSVKRLMMPHAFRIANAPCSWGVLEFESAASPSSYAPGARRDPRHRLRRHRVGRLGVHAHRARPAERRNSAHADWTSSARSCRCRSPTRPPTRPVPPPPSGPHGCCATPAAPAPSSCCRTTTPACPNASSAPGASPRPTG